MAVSRKDIEHVAKLCMLDSKSEQFERISKDFENIVGFVDKLRELDLSGVEDTLDLSRCNAFYPDAPVQALTREQLFANAPAVASGCIAVPRTIE